MEKKLRKYIFPNMLAMLGTSCYILADTLFISMAAGADGITALNLALPVYGLIFAIGSMIGIGSATRYTLSRTLGQADAEDYFSNSVMFALLGGAVFAALGIFCPDTVLKLMGADEQILSVGLSYIRIVLCFSPFFMLNYTFTAFVRNDNAPRRAMTATLISGIFNIIFDYVFMFPLKLGMAGAALATGMSPIVSMLVCLTHYASPKNTIVFVKRLPSFWKLFSSCKLGIVAFVGEISSGITTMVFNFLFLDLGGNAAVAAYGIIANAALVGTALFNGVAQGLQPLASSVHGRQDREAEWKIYRYSLRTSQIIAVCLVAAALVFTDRLVGIFNQENSAVLAEYARKGMRLYFPGFLFAAVNIVRAGFLSAVGKGLQSSAVALSRGIFSIVVFACLFSALFGMTGVWLAFPASELFTFLLFNGKRNPYPLSAAFPAPGQRLRLRR